MKSENLIKLESVVLKEARNSKAALAFSGGVDSTILLEVMKQADLDVLPLTFDLEESYKLPEVYNNTKERCYFCKSLMMGTLKEKASSEGYSVLFDGTNADDLKEYRPGLKALKEQGIVSPIAEAGLTKEQIRNIGRELGLEIADKPSSPCVMTRFPYNTVVSSEMREAVKKAETIVKDSGHEACRVRVYGKLSKIELPEEEFDSASEKLADNVLSVLKKIGVTEVEFDPKGLRSGTMDE